MRFRKIPRRSLINTVQLAEVSSRSGAFGKGEITYGQTVSRVRVIEPKDGLSVTSDNEQNSVSAVLLHQPGVSTDCTFRVGGHLFFNGQLYKIVGVKPIYELSKLHHTEVELSYVFADQT